jgi:alkanesulfonate monooxygenase SsuD/methylene tetrahydromethanopterin reductase-like flavin-dependent oxidoreductase (luciferase family)
MGNARQQFKEAAEAIIGALQTGVMEYSGEFVNQPRVELHPAPFASFRDRIYSATVSPESAEIMARLGTGVLVVPQKPWHLVQEETATYRATYREAIGEEPPPPIVAGWTFVDESPDRAEAMARKWMGSYWDSIINHYEFDKPHLKSTPGYEFHGQMYDRLTRPGGMERMTDFYVGLQPWGTPEQVYEKILTFNDMVGADSFIGVFRYGGMPVEDGERSMRLFAREVMPELQKLAPVAERVDLQAEVTTG